MADSEPGILRAKTSLAVVLLILGSGVLAVTLLLGLVALGGEDSTGLVLDWVTTVLLMVTSGGAVGALVQNSKTNRVVETVKEQTNGGLDVRIRAAVTQALKDHTKAGNTT